MKTCSKCEDTQPLTEFDRTRSGAHKSFCKTCRRKAAAMYTAECNARKAEREANRIFNQLMRNWKVRQEC